MSSSQKSSLIYSPPRNHQMPEALSSQITYSDHKGITLIEQSTTDRPFHLSKTNNNTVNQIYKSTQNSPNRKSKTFVYRSESPQRNSSYCKNGYSISSVQKNDAASFVSLTDSQHHPIYVEKIFKVEASNTQELEILRQRIKVLESQNKSLTEELIELRNRTPSQVEQIIYVENSDEINNLNEQLKRLRSSQLAQIDSLMRQIMDLENSKVLALLECENLRNNISELQKMNTAKDNTIKSLQIQIQQMGENILNLSEELDSRTAQAESFKRKVQELENFLKMKDDIINDLRGKLQSAEEVKQQTLSLELKCSKQEQEINAFRQQIEEQMKIISDLTVFLQQKDQEINKLKSSNSQLNIQIQQLQAINQEIQNKLNDAQNFSSLLNKEIENLNLSLADEIAKKNKNNALFQKELELHKQLEEKLVNLSLVIDFMGRKIESQQNENEELHKMMSDSEKLKNLIPQLENQIIQLSQQIEKLNTIIQEKDKFISQQIQEINKLQSVAAQVNQLNTQNQQMNDQIDVLHGIIQDKDVQIIKLSDQINQLSINTNQVPFLKDELKIIKDILNAKLTEIDGLHKRINEQDITILQLNCFKTKCSDYEHLINSLRAQNERLEIALNQEICLRQDLQDKFEFLTRERSSFDEKNIQLSQSIDFLQKKLAASEQQVRNYQQMQVSVLKIIEEWQKIQGHHNNFSALLESIAKVFGGNNNVGSYQSIHITTKSMFPALERRSSSLSKHD